MAGQKFNRLFVLEFDHVDPKNKSKFHWLCRCDCGKEFVAEGYNIRNGNTNSCGCYKRDRTKQVNTKHGGARTRLYGIYCGIVERCFTETHHRYPWYGGRGITVDSRWLGEGGFENFRNDMGPRPSGKHSVERRDNDEPYSKDNCEWATQKQQCRNMRSNVIVVHEGTKRLLIEACEEIGVPINRVSWRLKNGRNLEQALNDPLRTRR